MTGKPGPGAAWLVGGCLLLLAGLAPASAQADEYRPAPGHALDLVPPTTRGDALSTPRYVARDDATAGRSTRVQAVTAWAAAAEAVAAAYPGTRMAADLLHGAAHVFRRNSPAADPRRAMDLGTRALNVHTRDDPARIGVLLLLADEAEGTGNIPALDRFMTALGRWTATLDAWHARPPRDVRARAATRAWDRTFSELAARWHTAHGRHLQAAEAYVRSAARLGGSRRDRRLRQARSAYAWAGQPEHGARLAEHTYNSLSSDRERARSLVWRLYARHDMLDAHGRRSEIGSARGWVQSAAFAQDLQGVLTQLAPLERVTETYLELGSRAHLARDDRQALRIYLAALDNPSVTASARGVPSLWEGLLVAYAAAMRLSRYTDAERVLETIARTGEIPAARFEQLLIWLKGRRADAAATKRMTARIEAELERRRKAVSGKGAATAPRAARATLGVPPPTGGAVEPVWPADDPAAAPQRTSRLWLVLGLLALVILGITVLSLGRRRRLRKR